MPGEAAHMRHCLPHLFPPGQTLTLAESPLLQLQTPAPLSPLLLDSERRWAEKASQGCPLPFPGPRLEGP